MKSTRTKYSKYNPAANAGEVLLKNKRVACNCEASKHALINNCLSCGRIVCEQEGSGPCFTCDELVCTPKEQEQISRMSKAGCKLYSKLMGLGKEDTKETKLQEALSHRDRLLECDQTVERRTKVIDDQSDYFHTDSSWLSEKERTFLAKKKEEVREAIHGRKKNTFTFDFGEKKIVEEKPNLHVDVDQLFKPDTSIFECQGEIDIPDSFMPVYAEELPSGMNHEANPNEIVLKMKRIRIQDRDLQEMSDEGLCLSLHQPYASLLISGIKMHEGRDWYTNHRGRLWIHSAAKVPTAKEISEAVKAFKNILGYCNFPETYPTGVLLGCVDVVDCLPQLEYRSQFPDGAMASPYVFICENPRELSMKFPMKGNKKIFKLDTNIHQAAKKTLRKLD